MKNEKIIISGAGLAGSLLALLLSKRGFETKVYEKRPDMRKAKISAGRSINLALSDRGLRALEMAELGDKVAELSMPMYGRLIHSKNGEKKLFKYSGREGRFINSISRGGLNQLLMNEYEKTSGLNIKFEASISEIDYENKSISYFYGKNSEKRRTNFDRLIGADGAFSAVRNSFLNGNIKRFSYNQEYLDHGYKELEIPSTATGDFQIENDVLHIWPRGEYMMIALPNKDGSFTCTLFMPFDGENGFDNLNRDKKVLNFFEKEFADAIQFMPNLLEDYNRNPTSALATIKCFPWIKEDVALLLGDAAHAVVPFYGQGMNASFEDCRVFIELIEKHDKWKKIFNKFQELRKDNADSIAELAKSNYEEMRSHTADPIFQVKREIEMELEKRYKDFNSKYSLVTFSAGIDYKIAKKLGDKQDNLLMEICSKLKPNQKINYDEIFKKLEELKQNI